MADELAELRYAQPFEPFRIYLSNGRQYDVRHPELLFVEKHVCYIGVAAASEDYVLADHIVRIANDQITDAVPLTVADQIVAGDQR